MGVRRRVMAAAFLAAAFAGGIVLAAADMGKPAPAWALKDINGRTVKLADYKGKKGVLVVFFATWCPYCMEEVPKLKAFKQRFKDRRVEVIGIAVKRGQDENTLRSFAKKDKINYMLLLDREDKVRRAYGVMGIPALFGIDGDGVIRYKAHRLPKKEDQESLVRQLEAGTATEGEKPPEGVAT